MNEQRDFILDLYKNPPHQGILKNSTHHYHSLNASCGDEFTIELIVNDDKIVNAKFHGSGCAISTASCALLLDHIIGKTIQQAIKFTQDDLIQLLGVPISAGRIKCVTLGIEAVRKALR